VLDRAEVLNEKSDLKKMLVSLSGHARFTLSVASPQGLLDSEYFTGIRPTYLCLSLPHTPVQHECLWKALGVKTEVEELEGTDIMMKD
jgi:hypothetical protein